MSRFFKKLYAKYEALSHTDKTLVWTAYIAWCIGAAWRFVHILVLHRLDLFIYSDMNAYAKDALALLDPNTLLGPWTAIYPPGASMLFASLYFIGGGWQGVMLFNFLATSLIPLLIGAIAYMLFGRREACVSIILASLYASYVTYGGYLLSEMPFLFFALISFIFLLKAIRAKGELEQLLWGALAGLFLGITVSIRNIVMISAALLFLGILGLPKVRNGNRVFPAVFGAIGVFVIIVGLLSIRCTNLNEGHFCLISTNSAHNLLIGHNTDAVYFSFHDYERNVVHTFGNPVRIVKGDTGFIEFPFGVYESGKVLDAALTWIKAHPKEAFLLSFEHIEELYWGSYPWPIYWHSPRTAIASEWYFRIFILLPAVVHLIVLLRNRRYQNERGMQADVFLLLPAVGLMITVFLTLSEPRYRIPFDAFTIILASRAYTGAGTYLLPRIIRSIRRRRKLTH